MSELHGDEPTLAERQQAVAEKLETLVGLAHPRLADRALRLTLGDDNALLLTYGEITASWAGESEGLPGMPEAVRCDDPEVVCTLAEGHLHDIDEFLSSGITRSIPEELADCPVRELQSLLPGSADLSLFADVLHPTVEGYGWYRGLFVTIPAGGAAVVLVPWMQPNNRGGSPFPVVYTIGDPSLEVVREVAADYAAQGSSDASF